MSGHAFIVRMNPAGIDRVPIALQAGEISIGWGKCGRELLDFKLDRTAFSAHVHRSYYAVDANRIASGKTSGQLWRFIRVMSLGDLVVVPHGDRLHIAEVAGDAFYDPTPEHWAYRRTVKWLTGAAGRRRMDAADRLRSTLRQQLTCSEITHVLAEVRELSG